MPDEGRLYIYVVERHLFHKAEKMHAEAFCEGEDGGRGDNKEMET